MQFSNGNGPDIPPDLAGLRIVPLERFHLDQVLKIEVASFVCPWSRCHFERILGHDPLVLNRVGLRKGRVLGYLCAVLHEREVKINNFAVGVKFRRLGLGRRMLENLLEEALAAGCRTALLEVRPSNAAALGLYAQFGFVELGRLEGYYREEGEDAIVMRAKIGVSGTQ